MMMMMVMMMMMMMMMVILTVLHYNCIVRNSKQLRTCCANYTITLFVS